MEKSTNMGSNCCSRCCKTVCFDFSAPRRPKTIFQKTSRAAAKRGRTTRMAVFTRAADVSSSIDFLVALGSLGRSWGVPPSLLEPLCFQNVTPVLEKQHLFLNSRSPCSPGCFLSLSIVKYYINYIKYYNNIVKY